jgi:hypothetical protein
MLWNNLDYHFVALLLCVKYILNLLPYDLSKSRNSHLHVPKVIKLSGESDSFSFLHDFKLKVWEIIS